MAFLKNLFKVGVVGVGEPEDEDGVLVLIAGVGPRMNLSSRSVVSSLGRFPRGGGMIRDFLELEGFSPELGSFLSPAIRPLNTRSYILRFIQKIKLFINSNFTNLSDCCCPLLKLFVLLNQLQMVW